MAIATKGKRKITVDGTEYYWTIVTDGESINLGSTHSLRIISADKTFIVHYPLWQVIDELDNPARYNLIVVIGRSFGGPGKFGGCYQRVKCPTFEAQNQAITPKIVAALIQWAMTDQDHHFLDYRGQPIA
jgi:hypothetical protein